MKTNPRVGIILGFILVGVSSASAASLVSAAGVAALGVNPEGHLNATDPYGLAVNTPGVLGIARIPVPGDATAPGCLCEGWGVSINGTTSGYANVSTDGGANNLSVLSFTSDDVGLGAGTWATSLTEITGTGLTVKQEYTQILGNAFQDLVTITNNTGAAVTDLKYVRVMDWDVPPTPFFEFVTIVGTATTTELEESHLNGFWTANPLATGGESGFGGLNTDVTDAGPSDHGAYFRFNFGTLADGESKSFKIFYGAGADQADALGSLAALAPELYSMGQSYDSASGLANDASATYFFAFKGVGGSVVTPPVPDGGHTVMLIGLGLIGIGGVARRLRRS